MHFSTTVLGALTLTVPAFAERLLWSGYDRVTGMYLESLNPFIQACMYQKADTFNVQLVSASDLCQIGGGFNANAAKWVWKEVLPCAQETSRAVYFLYPNWNVTNFDGHNGTYAEELAEYQETLCPLELGGGFYSSEEDY
ncbi:hypothetical protein H2203_001665 [Taxawa tesnikishii (nom. ined.)]|nr:hypothetical protein H2203_001665 [Dothideales sp. JES 119]